jgi:serine/threonine-protein kinase
VADALPDPRTPRDIGPYRIEERLGAGGMGEVYRAWDQRLGRSVAVKLIRPEASGDARARERLRREARAAAGLSHPQVVQIFDIVEHGETEAIVMELVEGEPLSQLLHRDLKAENVMVTPEGHVKILDFGLARSLADDDATPLTQTDVVIGTYRCMSPEQAQGLPLDARSDLFSLGVLLYEMLTGQSPFQGSTALETLTRVCSHGQRPVSEVRPATPLPLSNLVDDLLQKDPLLRPPSARRVAAALAEIGSGDRPLPETEGGTTLQEPLAVVSTSSVGAALRGRPAPQGGHIGPPPTETIKGLGDPGHRGIAGGRARNRLVASGLEE